MHKLEISIQTVSSVIISRRSGDATLTSTHDHIPGSTMMGVFAYNYLKSRIPDHEFLRLFVHGDIVFKNLLISHHGKLTQPTPLIIKHPKNNNDVIINEFKYNEKDSATKYVSCSPYSIISGNDITFIPFRTELAFHHERNKKTCISQQGVILTYEALSPGQIFKGYITGKENDLNLIKSLISDSSEISIGRSKTAQYGKAILSYGDITPEVNSEELTPPYSMTLLSDTIIYNDNGFSVTSIEEMEKHLNTKIIHSMIQVKQIQGMLGVWKTSLPSENAFSAGSVFYLNSLPPNWQQIEESGIGERRNVGFGMVSFQPLQIYEYNQQALSNHPTTQISINSELAKDICRRIVENYILSEIHNNALKDATDTDLTDQSLSKSLVGRLEGFALGNNFHINLQHLRKDAKDKLSNTYIKNVGVMNHLESTSERLNDHLESILSRDTNISSLAPIIGISITTLSVVQLEREYLKVYFSVLRNRIKQAQGGKLCQ